MSIVSLMKCFSDIGRLNNEIGILTENEKDYIFNIMIRIFKTYSKEWEQEIKEQEIKEQEINYHNIL